MDNRNVTLRGERAMLVAYSEEYVETYHRWMCSPELLELTCSEPLSLEEERRNQAEWLESGDKLTFIILADDGTPVGDCNLFLLPDEGGSDGGDAEPSTEGYDPSAEGAGAGTTPASGLPCSVEVEVMVAEPQHRQKGLASEALRLLMRYALDALSPAPGRFVAKILEKNAPSRALFERLGFSCYKTVPAFEERHYCIAAGTPAWDSLFSVPEPHQ